MKSPKIFAVIHHKNEGLTLEQAIIANAFKLDGVFLISHHGQDEVLGPLGQEVKSLLPKLKVGINLLGHNILDCAEMARSNNLDMIWGDNCGVSSGETKEIGLELAKWKVNHPNMDVFASVAFKYQALETNIRKAAQNAKELNFIPTTSGSMTGSAPSLEKIQQMSEAVNGDLAIASGMNHNNVSMFAPYLSHILVSTGISKNEYEFDIHLLETFVNKVRHGL